MSPPQCESISSLPAELVEEYLVFIGPSELREMERVSRRLQSIIHHRKLWRNLFEQACRTSHWSLPHVEPKSWKQAFHQYVKEQNVFKASSRTDLSGSFVWRTLGIWNHLPDPYDTATSEPFELGTAQGAPVHWTLLVQHVVRDNCKHLGVFLQQEQANIWAAFKISILDRAGNAVASHTAYQTFEGGQDIATNTRGWLFPVQGIREALQNDELVVQVELTMFPNELPALESVYSLIQDVEVCEDTRVALIAVLGDYVSSKPFTVKRYLQEFNGGPIALISMLEDQRSSLRLQQAAAGALWNILDSSKIYLGEEVLERLINAACLGLHSIFCDEREELRHAKAAGAGAVVPFDGRRMCNSCAHDDLRYDDPCLSTDSEFRGHLVNTLTGLLWNIPITPQYRTLLASHQSFFPSLVAIINDQSVSRTHFSGLHLLSTMHKYHHLPAELVPVFRSRLQEKMGCDEATDVGVLLSLRDVADFFVPLLLSPKLECVAFGAWCLSLFYYEGAPVAV